MSTLCYDARVRKQKDNSIRTTENISHLTGKRRGGYLKEVAHTRNGEVIDYALAYINQRICGVDNGRVIGYDGNHGQHHRHFMGNVERIDFVSYEELVNRFEAEVRDLWRAEDGE